MSSVQAALKLAVNLREFPRIMYDSHVTLLRLNEASGEVSESLGTVVSFDLSRSGMRIFSPFPINESFLAVRFQSPAGMALTQTAKIVRTVHRNEWIWEYGLQFAVLLPESAM